MIRRSVFAALSLSLLLALVAAGCGGGDKDKEAAGKTCPPAAAPMQGAPALPAGFPTVSNVTYTAEKKDGPSEIVTGSTPSNVADAYNEFDLAISGASGYSVTKREHDPNDAEVNFDGGSSTGQVKIGAECKDRTSIVITARPK